MSGRHHLQPCFRRTLFELAGLMQPLKHRASTTQMHLGRVLLHQGLMQPGLLMPAAVLHELALPNPAAVMWLLHPGLMHLGEIETAADNGQTTPPDYF